MRGESSSSPFVSHQRSQSISQMYSIAPLSSNQGGDKEIRIWMDGAFDLMHYGHMNAFRQGWNDIIIHSYIIIVLLMNS